LYTSYYTKCNTYNIIQILILFQKFVKDQYLQYKITDDTTISLDPEKTSYWFTLGPRALEECDQLMLLNRVGEVSTIFSSEYRRVIGNQAWIKIFLLSYKQIIICILYVHIKLLKKECNRCINKNNSQKEYQNLYYVYLFKTYLKNIQ